jgi:hypothetical protein
MNNGTPIPQQLVDAINKQYSFITDYKYSIGRAYSSFLSKHINSVQFSGRSRSKCCGEVALSLLNSYIEIMMDFLLPGPVNGLGEALDTFPLSWEEMKHIELGINEICGTNYTIFQNEYLVNDPDLYKDYDVDTKIPDLIDPGNKPIQLFSPEILPNSGDFDELTREISINHINDPEYTVLYRDKFNSSDFPQYWGYYNGPMTIQFPNYGDRYEIEAKVIDETTQDPKVRRPDSTTTKSTYTRHMAPPVPNEYELVSINWNKPGRTAQSMVFDYNTPIGSIIEAIKSYYVTFDILQRSSNAIIEYSNINNAKWGRDYGNIYNQYVQGREEAQTFYWGLTMDGLNISNCDDNPNIDHLHLVELSVRGFAHTANINGVNFSMFNLEIDPSDPTGNTSKLCSNIYDRGSYYRWNEKRGYNLSDYIADKTTNPAKWNTERKDIFADWEPQNNPCPEGYRLPTVDELLSLSKVNYNWSTITVGDEHIPGVWIGDNADYANIKDPMGCIFIRLAGYLGPSYTDYSMDEYSFKIFSGGSTGFNDGGGQYKIYPFIWACDSNSSNGRPSGTKLLQNYAALSIRPVKI